MYCEEVIRALNKNRLPYLVIGGIAVNLYGLTRLTRDLDLMIDISEKNLDKFINIVGKLGYKTDIPRKKWVDLNAIAFINKKDETKRVDIFLKNPIDFKKAYKNKKVFKAGNLSIACVSLEDLIALKNKADRIRDWIDIGSLKKIYKMK